MGYFTSPGIDTKTKGPKAFSVFSERHWQSSRARNVAPVYQNFCRTTRYFYVVVRRSTVQKLLTIKKRYFYKQIKYAQILLVDQCRILFNKMYVLQGLFKSLVWEQVNSVSWVWFSQKNVQLATSGRPEIWEDDQISRAGGPMVHSLHWQEK